MTTVQIVDQSTAFDGDNLVALIPRIRSFARFLCRDATETEDLTQAALARAWRCRALYTPGTNMKAWVLTIVRNQFYSDKRRSWRVTELDPTVAEETLVAISNPSATLELDDVRRAMLELTDEQRQALNLITVAGLPYHEAAEICRCAVGTIKSRVSRARQALVAILAEGDLTGECRSPGLAMSTIIAEAERARHARPSRTRPADTRSPFSIAA